MEESDSKAEYASEDVGFMVDRTVTEGNGLTNGDSNGETEEGSTEKSVGDIDGVCMHTHIHTHPWESESEGFKEDEDVLKFVDRK
jgi:hypothetical protein